MDYVGGNEDVTDRQTGERNPRLLNEDRRVMQLKHYSLHTEQAGISWIRRFALASGKRTLRTHEVTYRPAPPETVQHLATI